MSGSFFSSTQPKNKDNSKHRLANKFINPFSLGKGNGYKKTHPHTFLTHLSLKAFQYFFWKFCGKLREHFQLFPGIRNQIKNINYGKKGIEVPQNPENFHGRDDKLYEGSGGDSS